MINYKNATFKKLIHHNDNPQNLHLCYLKNLLNTKIEKVKRDKYFENIPHKLSNKNLKILVQKVMLNDKRIPCIPPIYHNDKSVSDIKKKCHIFN